MALRRFITQLSRALAMCVVPGLCLGLFPIHSLAQETAHEPQVLLLADPRILNSEIATGGFDATSFTAALNFILSSDPSLRLARTSDETAARAAVGGSILRSSLQSLRNTIFWTGELRMDRSSASLKEGLEAQPIFLGPITVVDEKGLKPNALTEIAALIRRHLGNPTLPARRPTSISIACFVAKSPAAQSLMYDLRVSVELLLRKEPLISVIPTDGADCTQERIGLPSGTPRLTGDIKEENGQILISPMLTWANFEVPLPVFEAVTGQTLDQKNAYFDVLARAVSAVFAEYPQTILEALKDEPAKMALGEVLDVKHYEDYPYLKLALIQRGKGWTQDHKVLLIGKALMEVKAYGLAERYLQIAVSGQEHSADAFRQLGVTLFELHRFEEAEQAFRSSLALNDADDVKEKYAEVMYLLGDLEKSRELLSQSRQLSATARALAARIEIDDTQYSAGLKYLRQLNPDDVTWSEAGKLAKALAGSVLGQPRPTVEDLESAEQALTHVQAQFASDAEFYLLRARIRITEAVMSRKKVTSPAVEDFERTLQIGGVVAANRGDIVVAELEKAEAYFLGGDYREAVVSADAFLSRPDPQHLGLSSYHPVANLIKVAGVYLNGQGSGEEESTLRLIIGDHASTPSLYVDIPTGKGEVARVKLAEWSFTLFDEYICTALEGSEREIVKRLSDITQSLIGARNKRHTC